MNGQGAGSRIPCKICGNEAEFVGDALIPAFRCPRCGSYEYHATSPAGWLEVKTPDHMVRLSGWVREQNDAGIEFPIISPDLSRRLAQLRIPGMKVRAERVLQILIRMWPELNALYGLSDAALNLELLGRSYSPDANAALGLLGLLEDRGYIRNNGGAARLTPAGLLAAEELAAPAADSAQGFVAMSFASDLRDAWMNGFDPAIRAAGFDPLRLDDKDYVGGISDQIITEIRRSRFVIADYTGQVNGVYFEAGFALGLGLTVIPTCRADQFDHLHFDIRHLNTLRWTTPVDLVESLSRRIRAVIGSGPNYR